MRTRILTCIASPSGTLDRGDIVNLSTTAANNLINAGFAMPEGPDPSGTIHTAYTDGGYTAINPGGTPAANGSFYFPEPDRITVVFPSGKRMDLDLMGLDS